MNKNFVNIVAQLEPGIKPERQFQHLESERSQDSGSGKISQKERYSGDHRCPHCGSENLKSGAGLKPGQQSRRCADCGEFLGYSPIQNLKRLRRRKNLTDCLNLLESRGIVSQEAQIFLLTEVGAVVEREALDLGKLNTLS
jgi:hypothetical protein